MFNGFSSNFPNLLSFSLWSLGSVFFFQATIKVLFMHFCFWVIKRCILLRLFLYIPSFSWFLFAHLSNSHYPKIYKCWEGFNCSYLIKTNGQQILYSRCYCNHRLHSAYCSLSSCNFSTNWLFWWVEKSLRYLNQVRRWSISPNDILAKPCFDQTSQYQER